MKFISKNPDSGKNYWIEGYSPEDKEFLMGLGFIEKDYSHVPKSFGMNNNLYFTGSDIFGMWTDKEMDIIDNAIWDYLGTGFEIEQFIPH
jgi:hypothetical protein